MTASALLRESSLRLALALSVAGSGAVWAQELGPPTGLRAVLTYGTDVEVNTNRSLESESEGVSLLFDQELGLEIASETRTQSFALNADAALRALRSPSDGSLEFGFEEPNFAVRYGRVAPNAEFTIGGTYRRRQLLYLEPFFSDVDGDTIIDEGGFSEEEGSITQATLFVDLDTGLQSPIGTSYRLRYATRQYDDVTDPDFYDSENLRLNTSTRLVLSPVSTGRVNLGYQQFSYDDETETEGQIARASLGYDRAISETLTFGASLGYSRREETETVDGERDESVSDGLNYGLSLSKDLPLGTLFGELDRQISESGFRNSFNVGRTFERPGYSLAASIGLTNLDNEDTTTVLAFSYEKELADGAFSADLTRSVTLNTVDEENILTAVGIGYSKQINALQGISLGLDVARIQSVEEEESDERFEAAATAALSQSLTPDWDLQVGYRALYNEDEGDDSAVANIVFLSLGRSFLIRP